METPDWNEDDYERCDKYDSGPKILREIELPGTTSTVITTGKIYFETNTPKVTVKPVPTYNGDTDT